MIDRPTKEHDMLQTDTYYRGYRLSSTEGETRIYKDADHIDTVTLETKGRMRTTTDAAKDLIDEWMVGR